MDIIVKNYFEKFLNEYRITSGETDSNFEKFINYICLSNRNISNFNLLESCVGEGNDIGIDGIAIAINNRYVFDNAEIDDLISKGMNLNVEFFFIQAKNKNRFECKEILTFSEGVLDLFKSEEEDKKIMNKRIKTFYNMIRKIIDNYVYITSIKCNLLFVAAGKYIENEDYISTLNNIKKRLVDLEIFERENISVDIKDNAFIRKQYESTKVQNSAIFQLNDKIELPYMEGVEEAYFAIMPVKEYLNIVLDEEKRIKSGVFELNVRDFSGIEENRVNKDILATINSENKSYFALLNNGITIVGKSMSKMQGKYTIRNFYVVNGCQTTNILADKYDSITDDMKISVKFVITQNDDLIKNIVKATNNQTVVQELQLLSMEDYQQELESFFASYDEYTKLYYERRDGQYRGNINAIPLKIVNVLTQMRCFASIFLCKPHIASRFSGKLQDENINIFSKDDNPIIYYTSSLLNYHVEDAFNNEKIESSYYKFKFHIQMIIAEYIWGDDKRPALNSNKIVGYCEKVIKKIENEFIFEELLLKAKKCIDKVVKDINNTEITKSVSIVNEMLLYVHTGWTFFDYKNIKIFIDYIGEYLIPFKNMKSDGDLRYKFIKNLDYLERYTLDHPIAFEMIGETFFKGIKERLTEDSREERKLLSNEILNKYLEIYNNLHKTYLESKRYIK